MSKKWICQNAFHCNGRGAGCIGGLDCCTHSVPHAFEQSCYGGRYTCVREGIGTNCTLRKNGLCFRVRMCLRIDDEKEKEKRKK